MPLLDDARALLDIDRERIRILREAHDVSKATLDTAKELAQLGETERPKNEAFMRNMREGAVLLPAGGGSASDRAALPSRSSGGGGGSGGAGGPGRTGGVIRAQGGVTREIGWVAANCSRTTVQIPRPGGLRADDLVEVDAWDCSVPFIEAGIAFEPGGAIFLDPASVQAFLGPTRSSSSQGGGGGGGGGARPVPGGGLRDDPTRVPKDDPTRVPGGVSSSSTAPSADGKLLERTFREVGREIVRELRGSGDLGLQIRRNGAL